MDPLGWAANVLEAFGPLGVFLLLVLESVVPPIPSEAVLLLAGHLVDEGRFSWVAVFLASVAGSLVGASILYWGAAWLGEQRLRALVARFGRPFGLRAADFDKADAWFERHGPVVVSFGRLVPIVRSLVSVPAGWNRMPFGRFLLYTAAGSAVWNGALIGAGVAVGERWEVVRGWMQRFELLVALAVAGAAVWFVVRRWKAKRALATS
ncbi:MAG: DedA family protein [Acidimicrobiia bacterium]